MILVSSWVMCAEVVDRLGHTCKPSNRLVTAVPKLEIT